MLMIEYIPVLGIYGTQNSMSHLIEFEQALETIKLTSYLSIS